MTNALLFLSILLAGSCRSRGPGGDVPAGGDTPPVARQTVATPKEIRPVILHSVDDGDPPDTSQFYTPMGLTARSYSFGDGVWKLLPDTMADADLTVWRSRGGGVRAASQTHGWTRMTLRFASGGTLVEKSWRDGQNGCAEMVTVVLRYIVRDSRVVSADRRVIDQDGYELSKCFLGIDNLDSTYVTWPALAVSLHFPGK